MVILNLIFVFNFNIYFSMCEFIITKDKEIFKGFLWKNNILDGTWTHNLSLRRATPYPLGHEDEVKYFDNAHT